jgi:hypothetical protein
MWSVSSVKTWHDMISLYVHFTVHGTHHNVHRRRTGFKAIYLTYDNLCDVVTTGRKAMEQLWTIIEAEYHTRF